MKKLITSLLFLFSISVFGQANEWEKIKQVLDSQVVCWNKGDLVCYMQGYWNSPELKFVGKNGLKKGWKETLENYQKSYPDKAAMGELAFEIISHEQLSEGFYSVIGKWKLLREKDTLQGHFSLILKNNDGSWVIISDHSS